MTSVASQETRPKPHVARQIDVLDHPSPSLMLRYVLTLDASPIEIALSLDEHVIPVFVSA